MFFINYLICSYLLRFYYRFCLACFFCSFCLSRLFVALFGAFFIAFVWRVYLLLCLALVALAPSLFLLYRFLYISFFRYIDFSIYRWIGIKNRAKLIFLVFSAGLSGSFFLRVPPDWIRLLLLRIPPDAIRLSSIPAPRCPVPASSASGLLSLLPRLVLCAPPPLARFFLCPFRRIIRLFFLGSSAGCHPAFTYSRSTLSCAREFLSRYARTIFSRERVAIAFFPSLSCVRHLRWCVSCAFTSGGAPKYAYSGLNWPISQKNPQKFANLKKKQYLCTRKGFINLSSLLDVKQEDMRETSRKNILNNSK